MMSWVSTFEWNEDKQVNAGAKDKPRKLSTAKRATPKNPPTAIVVWSCPLSVVWCRPPNPNHSPPSSSCFRASSSPLDAFKTLILETFLLFASEKP